MSDDEFRRRSENIPLDPATLAPLGRFMWASVRLHYGLRDLLNFLGGSPSDDPFDDETGKLSTKVQDAASRQLKDNDLSGEQSAALEAVMHWCETNRSRPDGVVHLRNRVIHAVPFTDSKGEQALRAHARQNPDERTVLTPEHIATDTGRIGIADLELSTLTEKIRNVQAQDLS